MLQSCSPKQFITARYHMNIYISQPALVHAFAIGLIHQWNAWNYKIAGLRQNLDVQWTNLSTRYLINIG